MSSRLRGVPCVGIHKDAHIFCEILTRLEISRIAPWSKDANLSGQMALSANILAGSLGQLRRVGNGCMSARFCMNRARPVTAFASDTGFFKRRIVVAVHRSRDRPRSTRMATPTLTRHCSGQVKVVIVLVTLLKVPARFGRVVRDGAHKKIAVPLKHETAADISGSDEP